MAVSHLSTSAIKAVISFFPAFAFPSEAFVFIFSHHESPSFETILRMVAHFCNDASARLAAANHAAPDAGIAERSLSFQVGPLTL